MNKIIKFSLVVFFQLLISVSLFSQNDVTKFLGIPVDGYKPEMIQKLKSKGFTTNPNNKDGLVGEFNGIDVNIYIVTNNNKVWRIMVCDDNAISETDIRIRYNTLCQQFLNNGKYLPASLSEDDYTISEDEDISYELSVNNKRYEASFYQLPTNIDSTTLAKDIYDMLLTKYSEEQLSEPTDEVQTEIIKLTYLFMLEKYSKKSVWFMISDHYGKYYITMFYDNEYNKANGEDL